MRERTPSTTVIVPVRDGAGTIEEQLSAILAQEHDEPWELGGFDERLGGDEVELFWRAQLAGHDLTFVPEAVVHHRHREGIPATVRRHFRDGRQAARSAVSADLPWIVHDRRAAMRSWAWIPGHALRVAHDRRLRPRSVATTAERVGRLYEGLRLRGWYP